MSKSQAQFRAELPPGLQGAVEAELDGGERLFWTGQPIPRLMARKAIPIMFFGIPLIAFGMLWIWLSWRSGVSDAPMPFRLFPFVGVVPAMFGLAALSAPYWMMRKARRTIYAVTDRRAVVFNPGRLGALNVDTYAPNRLSSIERKQRSDGSGDLVFDRRETNLSVNGRPQMREVGFLAVRDVKGVETILRTLIETAKAAKES